MGGIIVRDVNNFVRHEDFVAVFLKDFEWEKGRKLNKKCRQTEKVLI